MKNGSKLKSRFVLRLAVLALMLLTIVSALSGCEILNEMIGTASPGGDTTTASSSGAPAPEGNMRMHCLDVGQGDAILLTTSKGCVLIDTSYNKNSVSDEIIKYIKDLGITKIDLLVLTHPHADHIGGAPEVIDAFDIEKILMPDKAANTKIFEDTLDAIERKNVDVYSAESGDVYTVGDLSLKVLAPISYSYGNEMNNYSVVIRATYGSVSFMLTGDAEKLSESEILNKFSPSELKCDVLKVGHHGSTTSSSSAFVKAVAPKFAAISCAEVNDYGHPHKETIDLLKNEKIETYITYRDGHIIFDTDGTAVSVVK